jgi:transcriptional regulator of heat shock response
MIANRAKMDNENNMNERSAQILEAAIQEYINTGEPVSSGHLYEQYDFGIKPAMIRLELDKLQEEGYLEQPHHAAGRVPTDSGYEFYAERALEAKENKADARRTAEQKMQSAFTKVLGRRALSDLLAELSNQLGLLSIALDPTRDEVHKTGLEALINKLDWEDRDSIRSVIHDFESVDARLPHAAEKMGTDLSIGPRVFIGKKSPVTRSESLSVIVGGYQVGDAVVSIFAIGPKRMDYKKAIEALGNL